MTTLEKIRDIFEKQGKAQHNHTEFGINPTHPDLYVKMPYHPVAVKDHKKYFGMKGVDVTGTLYGKKPKVKESSNQLSNGFYNEYIKGKSYESVINDSGGPSFFDKYFNGEIGNSALYNSLINAGLTQSAANIEDAAFAFKSESSEAKEKPETLGESKIKSELKEKKSKLVNILEEVPIGSKFKYYKDNDSSWEKTGEDTWSLENNEITSEMLIAKLLPDEVKDAIEDISSVLEKPKPEIKVNWDEQLEQIGEQKGSTPGGLYKYKEDNEFKYYIKFPGEHRAKIELLANNLYQLSGLNVPIVGVIDFKGEQAVASSWLENTKSLSETELVEMAQDPDDKYDLRKNFVFDAWIANWDVVGLDYDNLVLDKDTDKVYRIDPGGSLIYRAQGALKDFDDNVPELETMRNINYAKQAGKLYQHVTDIDLQKGAKKLLHISDKQIDDIVSSVKLETKEVAKLATTLKNRRNFITKKILGDVAPQDPSYTPGYHSHGENTNPHVESQVHSFGIISDGEDIYDIIGKHPNPKYKEILDKAKEFQWSLGVDLTEIAYFMEDVGLSKDGASIIHSGLSNWKGGGGTNTVFLRAAIAELKNRSNELFPTESGYFLYEKDATPGEFNKEWQSGVNNAIYLIPFIAKSRSALEKKYGGKKIIPEIYRGVKGNLAQKIHSAWNYTKKSDEKIGIPHDGHSGYSLNKQIAKNFGDIIFTKHNVPIDRVWLYFNSVTQAYSSEEEIIVDNAITNVFRKDEIEVKY